MSSVSKNELYFPLVLASPTIFTKTDRKKTHQKNNNKTATFALHLGSHFLCKQLKRIEKTYEQYTYRKKTEL